MKIAADNCIENLVLLNGAHTPVGDLWDKGEKDEKPVIEVTLKPFYLARYLVSNQEYLDFLNDTNPGIENELIDHEQPKYQHAIFAEKGRFSCKAGFEQYPVTFVSWIGAVEYCRWLSARTGLNLRLPTEAEWQYAAMTEERYRWARGNEFDPVQYVSGKEAPAPVNQGSSSGKGFYHLTGNVFEWCDDEYFFSMEKRPDEQLENMKVIKGGAFNFSFSENFTNSRKFSAYHYSCLDNISFRIAMSKN